MPGASAFAYFFPLGFLAAFAAVLQHRLELDQRHLRDSSKQVAEAVDEIDELVMLTVDLREAGLKVSIPVEGVHVRGLRDLPQLPAAQGERPMSAPADC